MRISDLVIYKIERDQILERIYKKYRKVFPLYISYLQKELADCKTILDLGCGPNSPIAYLSGSTYSVGVELFMPYLLTSKKKILHRDYILGDMRNIGFKSNSFDCVMALDVLEHLTKPEGYELLREMERIAKRKVIIFTVNGLVPQKEYDKNPLQVHKSGWCAKELTGLGYEVSGMNGLSVLRGEMSEPRFRPKIVFAFVSDITQKITFYFPKYAFQLFCVKRFEATKPNID
jgi:SAM-dependent methyltransferase